MLRVMNFQDTKCAVQLKQNIKSALHTKFGCPSFKEKAMTAKISKKPNVQGSETLGY